MPLLVLVAIGGVLGSLLRFALAEWLLPTDPALEWAITDFPWPTLVVNLVGCLAIGLLVPVVMGMADARRAAALRAFAVTGVLGGFTTYSAFASEAIGLGRSSSMLESAIYVVVTLVGGLLAVAAGQGFARRLRVVR